MDDGLFNARNARYAGRPVPGSIHSGTVLPGAPTTADPAGPVAPALEIRQAYFRRIEELRGYGAAEGIAINQDSENDFKAFANAMPTARKASLVLTDSGNLRAVWKDGAGSQLGLQFLGNRQVQYVIFSRRSNASSVSRVAGTDTLQGIKKQLAAGELHALVYA